MPAQYEHIRDSYVSKGVPLAEAKTIAAKTYNAHRKPGVAPVTGPDKLGDVMARKSK